MTTQIAASNTGRITRSTHKPKEPTPPLQPNLQKETQHHYGCTASVAAPRSPAAKHPLEPSGVAKHPPEGTTGYNPDGKTSIRTK